jgi:hypothetical protein
MMRALALALLLAGCAATSAPPATTVALDAFDARVRPGATTAAELLAAFGPTRKVVFDNGYQAWLYVVPAGGERYTELVLLIGPDGVVRKLRRRLPT